MFTWTQESQQQALVDEKSSCLHRRMHEHYEIFSLRLWRQTYLFRLDSVSAATAQEVKQFTITCAQKTTPQPDIHSCTGVPVEVRKIFTGFLHRFVEDRRLPGEVAEEFLAATHAGGIEGPDQ
ncbi:hypothetical protein TGRUB_323320 [Toxoplasma gondii RUB]|uniref:Rhoptry kinase family protein n=1 Tax=Toxoplasma gondii RUB TaxID=935652 RepID=A0A086LJ07_TOXGO|nr:hypothetical protein TGRUB_323320 [Toxoplasma gondii RUB]